MGGGGTEAGNLSNGTVMAYQGTVSRIKQHPIGSRKLKGVTLRHLQAYIDFLSFGGTKPDGTAAKALSKGVLTAVFRRSPTRGVPLRGVPKRLISFNPMQYNDLARKKREEYRLFDQGTGTLRLCPLSPMEQFGLEDFLKKKDNPAPIAHPDRPTTPGFALGRSAPSPGRTSTWTEGVPHGSAEHPLQQGEAQDRDRGYQTEESPHRGLLRPLAAILKAARGADQEPPALWGALQPELLYGGQGKDQAYYRSLHP